MDNKDIQTQLYQQQRSNKKYFAVIIMLLLVIALSIGYAVLTVSFNIKGTTILDPDTGWEVALGDDPITCPAGKTCTVAESEAEFQNSEPTDENDAIFWISGDTIFFKHLLKLPGDTFTFNATFENSGSVDAKVSSVSLPTLTELQNQFLTYSVTYSGGGQINQNDVLEAGQSAVFTVTVTYKSDVQIPPTEAQVNSIKATPAVFTVNYTTT